MAGKAGEPGALPPIVRVGGAAWRPQHERDKLRIDGSEPSYVTNNGFWVHSRHLWWQNEDTAELPDFVDRRSIKDLLKGAPPRVKPAGGAGKAGRREETESGGKT
jgi:hypothetical protein